MQYAVGIDEAASMTQVVNGWSFIVFPEASLSSFEKSAQEILDLSKLKSFHGKEFKRKKKQYYISFLSLIKTHAMQNKGSFVGFVINSERWEKEYRDFYLNLVNEVYKGIGISDPEAIKIAQKLIGALIQFQYRMDSYRFSKSDSFSIQVDTDAIKKKFDTEERILNIQSDLRYIVDKVKITDSSLLLLLYNKYKERFFKNTPDCKYISTCNDEDSFIIQAADIFGNFALAYIAYTLGRRSKTLKHKVEIFLEIFEEELKNIDFTNSVSICEDDIKLVEEGLATIAITNLDIR